MTFFFQDDVALGRTPRDEQVIRALWPDCADIQPTEMGSELDLNGIDYVVQSRRHGTFSIDMKVRKPGARKFWRTGEPELALERWSVVGRKDGCAWNSKDTTWFVYHFDPRDSTMVYALNGPCLAATFRANFDRWRLRFKGDTQTNTTWDSWAMFVPASVVIAAMRDHAADKWIARQADTTRPLLLSAFYAPRAYGV